MRIGILVTTYRRNEWLLRLITQYRGFIDGYRGPNQYSMCVADSDPANPIANTIQASCDCYAVNPGIGFDDNLFYFYKAHASNFDYLLSISDDDIFAPSYVNPLLFLDLAASIGAEAILFNHCDFKNCGENVIEIGNLYYTSAIFQSDKRSLLEAHLRKLPRHAGLMYSVPSLLKNMDDICRFNGTLHLYAAPFIFAARDGQAVFLNIPLLYFSNELAKDGAWENGQQVFDGLFLFAKLSKRYLNEVDYRIMVSGFMNSYLGSQAWLRLELMRRGYKPMPEETVVEHLL